MQAARERGVYVVLTTGRPLQAIGTFLEELDLLGENQYSITFNGGLVQENTGRVLDKVGFTIEDVRTIRRVTNDLDLPLDVLYGGDVYSLPSAHESLYLTCNPLLNKIVASDEEMPEDFVYNKAVSAVAADFWMDKFQKFLRNFTSVSRFSNRVIFCSNGVQKVFIKQMVWLS